MLRKQDSSKGIQPKRRDGDFWLKKDYWGGEGIAEHLVSKVLKHTGCQKFVEYSLEEDISICKSKDYLKSSDCKSFVSFQDLCIKRLKKGIYRDFLNENFFKYPISLSVNKISDLVSRMSGISVEELREYFYLMFNIDSMFLNQDRHLNNFGVFVNKENKYEIAWLYDFGCSMLIKDAILQRNPLNVLKEMSGKSLKLQPLSYNSLTLRKFFLKNECLNLDLDAFFNDISPKVIYTKVYAFFKHLVLQVSASEDFKHLFKEISTKFEIYAHEYNAKNINKIWLDSIASEIQKQYDLQNIQESLGTFKGANKIFLNEFETKYIIERLRG